MLSPSEQEAPPDNSIIPNSSSLTTSLSSTTTPSSRLGHTRQPAAPHAQSDTSAATAPADGSTIHEVVAEGETNTRHTTGDTYFGARPRPASSRLSENHPLHSFSEHPPQASIPPIPRADLYRVPHGPGLAAAATSPQRGAPAIGFQHDTRRPSHARPSHPEPGPRALSGAFRLAQTSTASAGQAHLRRKSSESTLLASSGPASARRGVWEGSALALGQARLRRHSSIPILEDVEDNESAEARPRIWRDDNVARENKMDVSTIPREFLEAYPYPAFVLMAPIPPAAESSSTDADELPIPPEAHAYPFSRSTHSAASTFDPVWANDKWRNLMQGHRLLESISVDTARELGQWIMGATKTPGGRAGAASAARPGASGKGDVTPQRRVPPLTAGVGVGARTGLSADANMDMQVDDDAVSPLSTATARRDPMEEAGAGLEAHAAPEGFWEPEVPYEDRASNSDHTCSESGMTGVEESDERHAGPSTLTIDLIDPGRITLDLTRTSAPIYQFGRTGSRTCMESHTYIIVTTVPRSEFVMNRPASVLDDAEDTPGAVAPTGSAFPLDAAFEAATAGSSAMFGRPPLPRTTVLPSPASPLRRPNTLEIVPPPNSGPGSAPRDAQITPTDEIMALDLSASGEGVGSRPLLFNKDGTVSRFENRNTTGYDARGKPLDVNVLLDTYEWEKTALGPRDQWPQSLRTVVSLIMRYPHQCCLWWGKDLNLIYNTAYAEMMHKHPDLFGQSGPVAWQEIWNSLGPLSELVLSGTPVSKEDDFLLFKQLPHQGTGTFEVYHSWMWVPIAQEDGSFGGLWNSTIDTTKKVLAERRLATVREMGERTSIARTMKEFDTAVIDIISANARDVPFAALYHVETKAATERKPTALGPGSAPVRQDTAATALGGSTKCELRLAGRVGIPNGHASMPPVIELTLSSKHRDSRAGLSHLTGSPTLSVVSSLSGGVKLTSTTSGASDDGQGGSGAGFGGMQLNMDAWPFREALQTRRIVLVEDCSALIEGYPIRVWDELPNAAVVVPIANDSDEGVPSAVIVIGLSIRRPFDDDYESFLHVLRLQLASGIAAVRSYEAERQRIEELAALDRAKSLLFSNVSHELRTPLTLVAGPLDDLLSDMKDGQKRELLVMARRNVRRLTRLVSTLMDVSRLEAGRLKGSFKLVNLGVMTRDLAALFRGAIERAKLRFVVECDLHAKITYVDPEHWEKIIFNLIGNALKYTMSGFVHVVLRYTHSEVVLSVMDSGVGIPASDIGLVGERFHRVQSVSRSFEGTGIGLALVKELIKLHGGSLSIISHTAAESADGSHGSTFNVSLPLGSAHLPRDAIDISISNVGQPLKSGYGHGIVDEAMQWNRDREGSSIGSGSDSGNAPSATESSGRSSRGLDPSTLYFKKEDVILLVDDSFDTRRYMRSIFAPFCSVVEARDGLEGLEACKKLMPDLIVTDVMMPNLDGFGLLTALKEDKQMSIVPVIMLTARGGEEAQIEGLLAGADDYLAKPFNARELIARAHMQLQLGKRRRALEEAFDERTTELKALTEYSPGGIIRADENGHLVYANSTWYELSGTTPSAHGGEDNWLDCVAPDHRARAQDLWQDVFDNHLSSQTGEWRFTNGRWIMIKMLRLDRISPGLKGILGCATDITERKANEETQRMRFKEAEQRRLEAEEAKHQQELLIDITSHEIRNPISSLMQCSSLVKTNLLSLLEQLELVMDQGAPFQPTKQLITTINEDLEALESIYQCGLTQERISNDVLSLGRIQLDMLQMFDVETDLRKEAQKVISIFQNEARMKRIALSMVIGESVERLGVHAVKTDPVRLGQVVTNLLSNGIRFTSNSSVRRIELRFDVSFDPPADGSCVMPGLPDPPAPGQLKDDMDVYLYVAVRDTGPGLTAKELDMLFQRFSQVSPKTHTIFGGSGLGLFVCRKITELMGGRIEVASEHGKGSTFRFFIKVRTCQTTKRHASIDADADMESAHGLSRPPMKRRHTGNKTGKSGKQGVAVGTALGPKPHVLIVEDNLINQTVLARQLRHVGLTCEVASNGLEALEKIRKVSSLVQPRVGQSFDCVLMDLEMPVMDGLTALGHIRAEEAAGTLALNLVIALTGNARQGQIDEAKAAGMDEVVIKPYRLDDLLQKIEDMMRIRATSSSPLSPVSVASQLPVPQAGHGSA